MAINPERFRKHHKGGGGPAMVNIRLRRAKRWGPPSALEVRRALQHLVDEGEVPDGWQFAAIDWRNPNRASSDWRSGVLHDIENFRGLIMETLRESRIAIVRPEPEHQLQTGAYALREKP